MRDGDRLVGEMRKVEVEGDQFRDSTVNRIKKQSRGMEICILIIVAN